MTKTTNPGTFRPKSSGKDKETPEIEALEQLNYEVQNMLKNSDNKNPSAVSEPAITYSAFLSNKLLIVQAIRQGMPYSLFSKIQAIIPFTITEWADYLEISSKSLSRYQKQNKKLTSMHTEKVIELAEVINLGLEVFGNTKKLMLWLETPNFALGNHRPFDLLKDSYGKEMIIGELTRINYGILV